MRVFVRDKGFYRKLLAITVPVALQNLINFSVSMADTVMVGLLGEVHLSAAALANQVGFVFMLYTFGLASGTNVMVAQYWGKGDTESIHKVVTIMYRVLLVGALAFTIIAVGFPRGAMSVFSTESAVIDTGAEFLRIVGCSYLLAGLSSTTVIMLRSVGSVKISVIVYLSSLLTNVFLNWVLIFGNLGAPALGITGAAIATFISRAVEVLITFTYLFKFENKICYRVKYFFERKVGHTREFIESGLPVLINELLWGSGSAMLSVIIGRMGTAFTAAYSVCGVLSQLVTVTIHGVSNAAAVIVGNTVGSGHYKRAKSYSGTLLIISVFMGFSACAVVLLLKNPMLMIYNISELAKTYARQIITLYSIVVIFQSFACVSLIGILRGGGDSRFVLLIDIIFMWSISIPVGFLAGHKLGLGVAIVYAIIKSDEVLKCFAAAARIISGQWVNDITTRSGEHNKKHAHSAENNY